MAVLTLGPEGTFSHEGARTLFSQKKIVFANSIHEIFFRLAEPEISEAVVPLESGEDFVEETIANLMKYDFSVTGKVSLKLAYHLVGEGGEITHLFSDSAAFQRCRNQIRERCPQVKWIETPTSAHSAMQYKAQSKGAAALISPFTQRLYELPLIAENMEEDQENFITFFSVGKTPPKKKKKNGTAFLLFSEPMTTITKQIAHLCHEKKIPLLKLKNLLLQEGHTPLYFVEVEGHLENKEVHALFEELSEKFLIKHLGSYPL